jgi:hypothetical protein
MRIVEPQDTNLKFGSMVGLTSFSMYMYQPRVEADLKLTVSIFNRSHSVVLFNIK